MLWSAFILAFFAFLCSSEFTSPSTSHFNALSHLSTRDISFNSDGSLSLHLKSSKTDPYRQGCSLLIAPSGRRSVQFVQKNTWPIIPSIQMASTSVWPLPHQSTSHLNTSHSFRIGAATTAAEAGLPPWLIQTLGRWSSNCFALYIRTPSSILQKV